MKLQLASPLVWMLFGTTAVFSLRFVETSYRDLQRKLYKLETEIKSAQTPVILKGRKEDGGQQTQREKRGTHIYIHVNAEDNKPSLTDEYSYASCFMQPNSVRTSNHSVHGFVYLRQKPSTQLEMKIAVSGFVKPGKYGFHVHENPSFQNGCNSFGGHLNPYGKNHGGPLDEERHLGDWGNLHVKSNLMVSETRTDKMASLFGANSIIGHGIDVHSGEDDLGKGGNAKSLRSGNAGPRIACCVVGWAKEGPW